MTEAEWLATDKPTPMLKFLHGKTSKRKMRLAICAFCSHIKSATTDDLYHAALNASEQYADGQVAWEVLSELAGRIDHFARPVDVLGLDVAMLPVYLLCRDQDLNSAAMNSVNNPWNRPVAVRQGLLALNIAYIRDVFGNPFRPVTFSPDWHTDTAVTLARQMYESREFSAMPILADALQDAGCDNEDILSHCRGDGPHVRGCWVVDLVLGKE
jgi:hypothetical protein